MCPSIFAPEARAAHPIGAGECSFDAPERRKYEGTNCGPIGSRGLCHVHSRKPLQNLSESAAGQTKGRIRLKLWWAHAIATLGW